MYCAHCGKELVEGANFCSTCGARAGAAGRVAAAEGLPGKAPEATGGVSAALASGRSRSRLHMPPIILLALALALTAGIAAAAYYVYTEVYLPSAQNDARNADDAPNGAPTGEQKTASYSFEYETAGGDGRNRFFYPVITSTEPSTVLDELNTSLRSEVTAAAEDSYPNEVLDNYSPEVGGGDGSHYIACCYCVTYFDGDVISIWKRSNRLTLGAVHSFYSSECETINLSTGERLEPESVMGLDKDALYSATYPVLYEATGGFATLRIASDSDGQSEVRSAVENSSSRFFLVPNGIAIAVSLYEFGSFFGQESTVVYVNDNADGGFAIGESISTASNPGSFAKLPNFPQQFTDEPLTL